jgi:hypothetical protein
LPYDERLAFVRLVDGERHLDDRDGSRDVPAK